MVAADPGVYPWPFVQDLHSAITIGAKGPTATCGIRSAYGRAVGDLLVTNLTSRHVVPEA